MSAVMRVPWENRLAKLVRKPGGVKLNEAVLQAEENLKSVQDSCLEALDGYLAETERLHVEGGAKPSEEAKESIYQLANDIHGMAGVFGLGDLGDAAFSLCELVDRLRAAGRWNAASVEVHLSALRLLRVPGEGHADMLEGLRRVVARIPRQAEG
jgi:hypothetical protein